MANTTLPGVLLSGAHAARPAANTVAKGALYAETDTGQTYQSDGVATWTAWGAVGATDPTTTRGDIPVRGASALGRLPVGAPHTFLQGGATDPSYGNLGGGTVDTFLDVSDGAGPANPAAGSHRLYSKAGGLFYRDSAGTETGPLGIGGSGGSGTAWPPLLDHAACLKLAVYGDGNYANTLNATDGDASTNANATTAAMPQNAQFDLGSNAPPLGSAHVVYNDANHRSKDGSLDWSDDGSAWTSAVTWTGDATSDRWHVFTPVAHRYWRIHTTAAGSGGSGVDIKTVQLLSSGVDQARGILPTSNNSYTSIANATDGSTATKATATGASFPSTFRVDLGAALAIVGAHFVFGDYQHSSATGILQSSTDDATWTDRSAWSNQYGVERFVDLSAAPVTARYWRIYTTAVYSSFGLDVAQFELASAT